MTDVKNEYDAVERVNTTEEMDHPTKPGAQVMRTRSDELGVWQALRSNKTLGLIAMSAAFSASLDGYQINLNGGIIANKGFIKQMATPGTAVIKGKYISAWGGMQSAGQFVGQVVGHTHPFMAILQIILTNCSFFNMQPISMAVRLPCISSGLCLLP